MSIIVLNKEDIRKHTLRQLDLQHEIAKDLGVEVIEIPALPQEYMLGFDSAVLSYKEGTGKFGRGFAETELKIDQNAHFFWSHFLGDPVMPGTIGTDGFLQTGCLWASLSGKYFGRPRALSGGFAFTGQVLPTSSKVFIRADIKREKFKGKKKVIIFEGTLSVDNRENVIYRFTDAMAGFYPADELSIESQNAIDYYQPDWEKCKEDMISAIDRAKDYYEKRKS